MEPIPLDAWDAAVLDRNVYDDEHDPFTQRLREFGWPSLLHLLTKPLPAPAPGHPGSDRHHETPLDYDDVD
jgi:hypothetical protein